MINLSQGGFWGCIFDTVDTGIQKLNKTMALMHRGSGRAGEEGRETEKQRAGA